MKIRSCCSKDVGDWRWKCPVGDDGGIVVALVDVIVVDFAYEFKLFKLLLLKLSIVWLVAIKKLSFWCELLRLIPFSLSNWLIKLQKKLKHEHEHKMFDNKTAKFKDMFGHIELLVFFRVINYKMCSVVV